MAESESVNIGSALRRRRQELNLSIEEVAEKTKIRKTYILAIEEERFEELPGKVYVIGFLQNYARFLDLPAQPLVEAFNALPDPVPRLTASRTGLRGDILASRRGLQFGKFLPGLCLVVIAGAVLFYATEILDLFNPPANQEAVGQEAERLPGDPERDLSASEKSSTAPSPPTPHAEQVVSVENSPGSSDSETSLPAIPEGGGTLKIISQGPGEFQIAIDGGEFRKYLARSGVTLSWQVGERAELKLNVEGTVRLVVDGRDYVAPGQGQLLLTTSAAQEE